MLKPNPTGSEETMYDMDKLLEFYIVEYVKKRQAQIQALSKNFNS